MFDNRGIVFKEPRNTVPFAVGDIDQEQIGSIGWRREAYFFQKRILQEVNAQRDHDTDAEACQDRCRVRTRTIEIRESMTEHCGAADDLKLRKTPDAVQKNSSQRAEDKKATDENRRKNSRILDGRAHPYSYPP